MNTLIIYSHPNHESLNYSILQAALKGLRANKGAPSLQVTDLYAEGFDPVLVFNQNQRRRDMHTVQELEEYREQIRWADKIVFVYPIWWGRPPAMLLGYIDRIYANHFAYEYEAKRLMPKGLLKGKSVVCISTMKGPKMYPALVLNNAHKALMRKAVFNFVGIKRIKFLELGGAESRSGKQKEMLKKVEDYFTSC